MLVRSAFNDKVVSGLVQGAREYAEESGALVDEIVAPGAFELPLLAQEAALTKRFDAVVALGAVIRGDTDHYEHIARECARGLMNASLVTGVPIAFGVLTVAKVAQAVARSKPGAKNKGREAAAAAIESALALRSLRRRR